jgi:hypothetical protein
MANIETPRTRRFQITRKADKSFDLEWNPPEGSVALFDALREAYPEAQTLKELMANASIEFFTNEVNEERRKTKLDTRELPSLSPPNSDCSFAGIVAPDSSSTAVTDPRKFAATRTSIEATSLPTSPTDQLTASTNVRVRISTSDTEQLNEKNVSPRDHMRSMMNTFQLPREGHRPRKVKRPMTDVERRETAYVRRVKPCQKHKQSKHKVSRPLYAKMITSSDIHSAIAYSRRDDRFIVQVLLPRHSIH